MFTSTYLCMMLCLLSADRRDGETSLKPASKGIALEPAVGDLRGYYTCKGVESGGKTYSGIAVIEKRNEVYVIQWIIGAGSTFAGIGMRVGDNFSAAWSMKGEKGTICGSNMYRIDPGPRLVGRWATLPGNGQMQSETLTFLKHLEPEE